MVRIAISQAAFEAIVAIMRLGSVGYENESNENGERLIWLPHDVLGKLNRLRGTDETCSDVILALANGLAVG
jgi:hypothetical protein